MKNSNKGYTVITAVCAVLIIIISAIMIRGTYLNKKLTQNKEQVPYSETENNSEQKNGKSDANNKQNKGEDNENLSEPLNRNDSGTNKIILTDKALAEKLNEYIPQDCPVKNIDVKISADGNISVSGEGNKTEILKYLEDNNVKIPKAIKSSLIFISDDITAGADFSIEKDEHNGLLRLTPQSVTINSIVFPADTFSAYIPDSLGESVNKIICGENQSFTDIYVSDGQIEIAE